MSITHLIVFLVQFFLFVPLFFILFIKAPKGSKNKKVFLAVALIAICYASVDAYFHRYLIMSDFYYAQGDWKKSGVVAEKGFKYLEDKSELYDFVYGRFSLYRKMKRAEKKINPAGQQNSPTVNQDVAVTQEFIDQNDPGGNENVGADQENIDESTPAVNEETTAEQEAVDQEDSAIDDEEMSTEQEDAEQEDSVVNEEMGAEQESVEQEGPVVDEEVTAEQEDVEQEDSAVNDEVSTGQEEVEQEESIVDEEAPDVPEDTEEVEPEGAAAGE
ncbi:MAG: hypothetical protein SD837_01360 [Candidatus Electrothrix scaldis]|nr:MAG: hypothetical protein SD837_01360 [Candidatus Electrothrix sp. GW3-3]